MRILAISLLLLACTQYTCFGQYDDEGERFYLAVTKRANAEVFISHNGTLRKSSIPGAGALIGIAEGPTGYCGILAARDTPWTFESLKTYNPSAVFVARHDIISIDSLAYQLRRNIIAQVLDSVGYYASNDRGAALAYVDSAASLAWDSTLDEYIPAPDSVTNFHFYFNRYFGIIEPGLVSISYSAHDTVLLAKYIQTIEGPLSGAAATTEYFHYQITALCYEDVNFLIAALNNIGDRQIRSYCKENLLNVIEAYWGVITLPSPPAKPSSKNIFANYYHNPKKLSAEKKRILRLIKRNVLLS